MRVCEKKGYTCVSAIIDTSVSHESTFSNHKIKRNYPEELLFMIMVLLISLPVQDLPLLYSLSSFSFFLIFVSISEANLVSYWEWQGSASNSDCGLRGVHCVIGGWQVRKFAPKVMQVS